MLTGLHLYKDTCLLGNTAVLGVSQSSIFLLRFPHLNSITQNFKRDDNWLFLCSSEFLTYEGSLNQHIQLFGSTRLGFALLCFASQLILLFTTLDILSTYILNILITFFVIFFLFLSFFIFHY